MSVCIGGEGTVFCIKYHMHIVNMGAKWKSWIHRVLGLGISYFFFFFCYVQLDGKIFFSVFVCVDAPLSA